MHPFRVRKRRGVLSLLKRESAPHPRKRNVGGFRNSPHTPLKRPDQGGLRAPLFWTSSPGTSSPAARSNAERAERGVGGEHRPPESFAAGLSAGTQLFNLQSEAQPVQTEILLRTDSLNFRNQANRRPGGAVGFAAYKAPFFSRGAAVFFGRNPKKMGAHSLRQGRKSPAPWNGATPVLVKTSPKE